MRATLNTVWQDFIALFFPEYCYGCEKSLAKGEAIICTTCRLKLPYAPIPDAQDLTRNELRQRFFGKVPVKHALAFLYFKRLGRVQRLLHALKYQGIQEVGELLGNWFGAALQKQGYAAEFDIILPVPLHQTKLRQRGYNQSDSFAQGLATALATQWSNQILKRTINTKSQTNKTRPERWENVAQVFAVVKPEEVIGKKILLVDDVMTTGATLEACALTLLKAGCAEVSVGAIAAA